MQQQQQQLNKVQQQRTTNFNVASKTSSIKDSHNSSNNNMVVTMSTGPLVCKNTPPVKRTIQIKPDHDIKVDINANSGTEEEKPKINGGLSPLNNNNDEDSVDNELSNGDDMGDLFDLSLEDSDCVKSAAAERGRATRSCSNNRKIKAKKTRAK